MDEARINAIVEAVLQELRGPAQPPGREAAGAASVSDEGRKGAAATGGKRANGEPPALSIDLPDPTVPEARYRPGVAQAADPEALRALIASTSARIGVGRAGPRYRTASWLLFQADHAVTQDALYRDVDPKLLEDLGLFSVQTRVTGGKAEYLLRPDLGRQLDDESKRQILAKCTKAPNLQLVVGDGLSAAAVEANAREMFPVIIQGAQAAGLSVGTPFFIKHCRVGVLNDIGALLNPDVVILLIGERPGLGRAESLSAYMAYRPKPGDSDADRDVVCNIFNNGGTNPLEAGAYVLQIAQKMSRHGASGVRLRREAGS